MKIVIFDMDGTLLDSKKDITASVNYVRKKHHNLTPLSEEYIVKAINMQERNLAKLFYETEVYLQEDRALFERHYEIECIKNVYLYEEIEETLRYLAEAKVKLSVATNAPTPFALRMLGHLGVQPFFDVIIGADRVSASKPNPEMLHRILHYYGYDRIQHKAWMVGDNSKDILSAQSAGIEPIFATWGFSITGNSDIVIKKPAEILDIVL